MSKPSAPPPAGFVPQEAPPSYNQTMGVPPQAPYYQQQPVGPQATHVTVVTTVVPPGPNSTHMVCPSCHNEIDTSVKTTPSTIAWLSGGIIFLLGGWMGCCLIPCCIQECMDRDHFCPNCKSFLGRYH